MRRETAGIAIVLIFLRPALASAHDRGTSTSDLELRPDGTAHAHFMFAAADDPGSDDVATVRADGTPCPRAAAPEVHASGDGVEVDVDYRCARGAFAYELRVDALESMGTTHRNVASIHAGERMSQAILTPSSPTVRLELPRPSETEAPSRTGRWLVVAAVAGIVVLLVVRARRIA